MGEQRTLGWYRDFCEKFDLEAGHQWLDMKIGEQGRDEPVVADEGQMISFLVNLGGTTMDQKPSVGRIVHYQSYGTPGGEFPSAPRAAIIAAVDPAHDGQRVDLCVLNPNGMFFNTGVWFSETPKPGYWNWPPRV